jgi:hypothetical protein
MPTKLGSTILGERTLESDSHKSMSSQRFPNFLSVSYEKHEVLPLLTGADHFQFFTSQLLLPVKHLESKSIVR